MLLCYFDEKNSKKPHSKLLDVLLFLSWRCFFNAIILFFYQNAHNNECYYFVRKGRVQKADFSGLYTSDSFDIKTRGQVFCIALGPVTICKLFPTEELKYCIYFTIQRDILNA